MTDIDLATIPYYTFKVGTFASEENVIISNTGYTGAGGFELYFYPSAADSIWKAIFEAGEEYGIKPIGLGARDTLRLEMCLIIHDSIHYTHLKKLVFQVHLADKCLYQNLLKLLLKLLLKK